MSIRPNSLRLPNLTPIVSPISPATPDERRGEQDYFSRPAAIVPMITIDPTLLSPNTLQRVAPAAAPLPAVEIPVAVPRLWGRRIPLPIRVSYALATVALMAFAGGMSTLGIAIANRIARQKAGETA
jgi:hypothetical protein